MPRQKYERMKRDLFTRFFVIDYEMKKQRYECEFVRYAYVYKENDKDGNDYWKVLVVFDQKHTEGTAINALKIDNVVGIKDKKIDIFESMKGNKIICTIDNSKSEKMQRSDRYIITDFYMQKDVYDRIENIKYLLAVNDIEDDKPCWKVFITFHGLRSFCRMKDLLDDRKIIDPKNELSVDILQELGNKKIEFEFICKK